MEYVYDLGLNLPKIEFDVNDYELSGYGRNTINGVAFTSFTGEIDCGFNYSFGMMSDRDGETFFNVRRIKKHQIHSPYYHNKPTKVFPKIEQVWNMISSLGIEMFRCRLSLIKAGGEIPEHSDTCSEDDYCVKVHIPLVTNDSARFIFGDKSYKMDSGRAYVANVAKKHSFINPEPYDRYHIIADCIVRNEKLPLYCKHPDKVIEYYNMWEDIMNGSVENIDWFNQKQFYDLTFSGSPNGMLSLL